MIPVYNEGPQIIEVLGTLRAGVKTPFRVLICYDHENDSTLAALKDYEPQEFEIVPVKNRGAGAHAAVLSGFAASTAPWVLVFPADDTYNAGMLDEMVSVGESGCQIVPASRFMRGGKMVGCPPLKAFLVRASAVALHAIARVPTHDPSNGFRLFSKRVLDSIVIESGRGFTYSIELLVKCHRLGWKIGEVPAQWFERTTGKSRFRVLNWLPAYLHWFFYAFATTYLRRAATTVPIRVSMPQEPKQTPESTHASSRAR